jgi:hypothetical protein
MCEAGDTTLSIFLRNRRRWDETVDYSTSQSDETIQEVFVGTLTVLPPDATCQGSARYRIMASFQQHVYDRGYTFLTPSISFYSVIPESSEIFTIAEKGDLDGLVRLLASGKGSLRDIDAVGRTLLHVCSLSSIAFPVF